MGATLVVFREPYAVQPYVELEEKLLQSKHLNIGVSLQSTIGFV